MRDDYTKKELKRFEQFARINNIEIITECRNCHEHFCTIEEWKIIKKCDNCKTSDFLVFYFIPEDVIQLSVIRGKEK